ncbi:MAG: helix-turn-helix transcriptional regulator [Pirellulales bacterium]
MTIATKRISRNEAYRAASRDRLSVNLETLMRRRRITPDELAARAGLHEAIVRSLVRGEISSPNLTTLDLLATALEVDGAALLAAEPRDDARGFDRRTNPIVAEVAAAHPQVFCDWTPADYDDLYSRFGVGGPLNAAGALECAQAINRRRELATKMAVLLETEHGSALTQEVDRLYSSVVLS